MSIHRNDCRSSLRAGRALTGCLCAILYLAGCRLSDSSQGGALKSLLRDGSAEEAAIRKAAIEDTSFPTAAQPIPKK
jgi:hypothetical protein